jgi:hypothetical protein
VMDKLNLSSLADLLALKKSQNSFKSWSKEFSEISLMANIRS